MIKCWIFLFFGVTTVLSAGENMLKNPGGENYVNNQWRDWRYNRKNKKYHFADSEVKHSGKYSLRFQDVTSAYDSFSQVLKPVSEFKDDIVIRGWVKYENLVDKGVDGKLCSMPFIGIWTYSANGRNNFSLPALKFQPGSRDWFFFEHRYKAEDFQKRIASMRHDLRPEQWGFRINIYKQPGKVWVDDLEMVALPAAGLTARLSGSAFTSDHKTLSLELNSVTPVSVEIKNASGTLVEQCKIKSGTHKKEFLLENFPPGAYSVVVTPESGDDKTVTLKFTKEASAFDE